MIDRELVILALREAFNAGVRQGEDSATAFEWGSSPMLKDKQAFEECIAEYNGETDPIQMLFAALAPTPPLTAEEKK